MRKAPWKLPLQKIAPWKPPSSQKIATYENTHLWRPPPSENCPQENYPQKITPKKIVPD